MSRLTSPDHIETAVRGLLGAADVDGGPTDEQRDLIRAVVAGYWQRPDLDIGGLEPLGPDAVAPLLTDAVERARFHQLLVLLELARHPLSAAQTDRAEAYADALGVDEPERVMNRDLVTAGIEAARDDYRRLLASSEGELEEVSLQGHEPVDAATNAALAARLRGFAELPDDTLGHMFLSFYERNGLRLPGDDPRTPAVFVSHDMTHVIGGYEPTGPGEIALGAMLLAVTDSHAHWVGFLGNLAVHEVGIVGHEGLDPKTATLARPGAPELVADAFRRGAACTADFSCADHLAMAEWPIERVRAEFGVPPLELAQ